MGETGTMISGGRMGKGTMYGVSSVRIEQFKSVLLERKKAKKMNPDHGTLRCFSLGSVKFVEVTYAKQRFKASLPAGIEINFDGRSLTIGAGTTRLIRPPDEVLGIINTIQEYRDSPLDSDSESSTPSPAISMVSASAQEATPVTSTSEDGSEGDEF